jgi:hypothetical protein
MTIEKITNGGLTLRLEHDSDAESPRGYQESVFFGFHNRVVSPDTPPRPRPPTARAIAESRDNICLPVWMYDHGARVYQAAESNPFSCPWDSGLFGFIYISRADARKRYAISRITKGYLAKIKADLAQEVATYSQWANGEFYRWYIENGEGDCIDSCGGYDCQDYALTEGKEALQELAQVTRQFEEDLAT